MPDLRAQTEEALRAAEEAMFHPLDALPGAVAAAGVSEEAAAATLAGAARWWYDRPGAALPSLAQVATFSGADGSAARALAARTALLMARASLLAFDRDGLRVWQELGERLAGANASEDVRLGLRAAVLWRRHLEGEDVGPAARDLGAAAAAAKVAPLVIETTALRALIALAAGDLEEARDTARRASRMGRTEALPDGEFLANVVLARVRRISGEPHLAARILSALARHAPRPWQGWLAWELVMSGGMGAAEALLARLPAGTNPAFRDRSAAAAASLVAALGAARRGERPSFEAAAAALSGDLAGTGATAREAEVALQALDAAREAGALLGPWRRGETEVLPLGLYGLAADEAQASSGLETVLASVVIAPGQTGRRVLSLALPLSAQGGAGGIQVLPQAERVYGRTDAGLAALALAGPQGLPRDEFFRIVYGFSYSSNVHRGSFNVLVHRMRKRAEGVAEVLRDGDRLALRVECAFAVADPRCVEPTVARVLRLLASRGASKAEDLAGDLQVSQRTVQMALQQLLADGVCQQERSGREIRYKVDDTTFSEPTPWAGAGLPPRR